MQVKIKLIIYILLNTNDEFCVLDKMLTHPGPGFLRGGGGH